MRRDAQPRWNADAVQVQSELQEEYGGLLRRFAPVVARQQRGRHFREIVGTDVDQADSLLRARGVLARSLGRRPLGHLAAALTNVGVAAMTLSIPVTGVVVSSLLLYGGLVVFLVGLYLLWVWC